mmetsp:Transcript_18253/g.27370  ORF Transcript_18253/g.27370 Transcript_18253/m.27370 type:complete len:167 (-) Transcript_18253:12-512(-)
MQCFTAEDSTSTAFKNKPLWTNNYIFVLSEWELNSSPSASNLKYFKHKFNSHKKITNFFYGKSSSHINTDLDTPVITKNNSVTSLREMTLKIPSNKKDELDTEKLFHAIDFCPNLKEVWFKGSRGTGGQGHIFTFFKYHSNEAMAMIKGLGIYLSSVYGNKTIGPC